jgi:hypothetical protein
VIVHVNRGMLGWGVFLIALGGVPAAVRGGALDPSAARRAWELWPLLLVGAGLGLALARTRVAFVGGVVVALVFGLIGGGVVAGGIGTGGGFAVCGFGAGSAGGAAAAPAPATTGTFGGSADVRLAADCGSMTVAPGADSTWFVTWTGDLSRPPVITASGDRLSVQGARRDGLQLGTTPGEWTVTLPRDPVLTIALSVNAGSATASLGGLHLDALDVSVNAGDARLDLTGATGVRNVNASANFGSLSVTLPQPDGVLAGSLSANVGSLRICAPAGAPLVIRLGSHSLGSDNFASRGLAKADDGTWTRGDVIAAASRLDLRVDANLGSITLDPEDGCG